MTIQEALKKATESSSLIRPIFWKGMAVEPAVGSMWVKKPGVSDKNKSVYYLTPNDIISEWEIVSMETLVAET